MAVAASALSFRAPMAAALLEYVISGFVDMTDLV
jgi:hypothetical protein